MSDVAASADFYRIVLAPLGIEQTSADPPEFGALSFVERAVPEPLHFAFIAESQEAVRSFHHAGLVAGYRSNGAPGLRRYADDYYAAYLLDPDGHNVEAVHRSPETRAEWKWLAKGSAPNAGSRALTASARGSRPSRLRERPLTWERPARQVR